MNEIDFTKMKPDKKKRLIKCPDCGRVGELNKYRDGSAHINHKGKLECSFFFVSDCCFFSNW